MICPSCKHEPLKRNKYIWKPQAVTLDCSHCGTKLRMAPNTLLVAVVSIFCSAALLIVLGLVIVRWFLGDIRGLPSAAVIAALIVGGIAFCVLEAITLRMMLWRLPYVIDAR